VKLPLAETGSDRLAAAVLALAVLAGGALRARQAAAPGPLTADELSYRRLALSLAEHGSYGTARMDALHWPPGAPALFTLGHLLGGGPAMPAAYWLQAACGVALIVVTFGLGTLLATPLAGAASAVLVALYPPLVDLSGTLLSEGLGCLLAAVAALACAWACVRGGWWRFALAGVAFGVAILTRADLLVAPPVVAAAIAAAAWRRRSRALAYGAAALLAAAAVTLAPWVAYASHRDGRLVPVTTGDGAALFVGTYLPGDGTTSGMKAALGAGVKAAAPRLRRVPDRRLPAAAVLAYVAAGHRAPDRDAALRAAGRENLRRYALGQPLAFARMMVAKAARMWLLSSRVGAPTASALTRAAHAAGVVALALLALAGMLAPRPRRLAVGTVLAVPLASTLLHALVVAKPRYNLPLLALVASAGCAGAVTLAGRPAVRRLAARVAAGGPRARSASRS
jgi:4-amino-4-deoxy-L-arabinose transferase-like glycosyltransferase